MPDDFVSHDMDGAALDALLVDVEGYEGPLDILLTLARTQKVDLRQISILALAEQYLAFIERAKSLRIELAADYLVMAAWLAYLKSRLLLPPDPEEDGPSAEDMAAHLAFQLERLNAMRRAAARLMARDQKGKDFFQRGMTETIDVRRRIEWDASLLDLMRAYARIKTRDNYEPLHMSRPALLTLDQALDRLRAMVGDVIDWADISSFLPAEWVGDPEKRRSALASTFAASLELAKQGQVEIRQTETFGALSLRAQSPSAQSPNAQSPHDGGRPA